MGADGSEGFLFPSCKEGGGTIDKGILLRMYGPVILVVTVIAVGISVLLYATVIYDSRQTISQELFLHERYLFHNPQDVTSQTCSTALPCVWASASDESTVMTFESKDEAEAAISALLGAYQPNGLVVRFHPNELTDAERAAFMKVVNGIYHSDDAWFDEFGVMRLFAG